MMAFLPHFALAAIMMAFLPHFALAAMFRNISAALHPPARSFRPAGAELICGGSSHSTAMGGDMFRNMLPDASFVRQVPKPWRIHC